ncbi:hypothetical protein ACJMK2_007320 [Sinanodonta woodiana]|uniref:Uncharacterized protein n=1 Tax=Sinanodonta woodiana TaxID=1069815 RepID=A0ABD3VL74_SINWO
MGDTLWFTLSVKLLVVTVLVSRADADPLDTTIQRLFDKIYSLQVKRDEPFIPPLFWEKHKGMYESDVKFYFHGGPDMTLFRHSFKVYDDNMFATSWITSCLLEAYKFGNGPKPSEEQIVSAVASLKAYQDKNLNYTNSLMAFWPQHYNSTSKTWVSYPDNLHNFFEIVGDFNWTKVEDFLKKLGFSDVALIMERLLAVRTMYLGAFLLPPDFDDTFVNLGLGSLLSSLADDLPQSYEQWRSQNTNISSIFSALKRFAYRPLSNNYAVNLIDERTYVFLRFFLEKLQNDNEDIALIPTWVQDLKEEEVWAQRGVHIPGNTNNVDVTVAANGVFGITSAILNGLLEPEILDDPEMQQIYLNTSSLIGFMISTNFSARRDLALLYYPSEFEFYWFVARTYAELRQFSKKGSLPHPVMKRVEDYLGESLKTNMTATILNAVISDGNTMIYFDDFLGDGDLDANNKTVKYAEDRLYTTAMAVNALITTWTVYDEKTKSLIWDKDTPTEVHHTIEKSANFLVNNVLDSNLKPWNAFFSGSIKGPTTYGGYPLNMMEFFNGTVIPGDVHQFHYYENSAIGVQGIIPETEYQELLKEKWFGRLPITEFHGFNAYPDYWPFWCSEAYTYVTSLLALAKFKNAGGFGYVD